MGDFKTFKSSAAVYGRDYEKNSKLELRSETKFSPSFLDKPEGMALPVSCFRFIILLASKGQTTEA